MAEENSATGRLIAIGDIHGHAAALESILNAILPGPDDTIVTLGDYINRGPESRKVLDLLIDLSHRCQLIPILGNHEEMMLDSRDDPHADLRWQSQGGDATLASYGPNAGIGNIPQAHWNFLLSCRRYYETDQFVFTHANYCWYSKLDEQPPLLQRWLSLEESPPRAHLNGKRFVVGHTPGTIRDYGFCLCIDTCCGFCGRLTAFEMNTGQIWQVEENGELDAE
ncbi:MAG: serine/threonine protein phosphatase [Planctomycetaceae bacterium]|nr:serine/threonine protein phosphatase [Planctomycetaceae bacterium]